ncbi:MAG: HemK family protein methyltransferase, partial [Planctomycetota bacterium]
GEGLRVADVGTGTGAIAIALAIHLPGCQVVATDISEPALEVARWNAEQHGVSERITFVECDLLEGVSGDSFDLICSNPPYVSEAEFLELDQGIREYEPRTALVAGDDGTELIKRLLAEGYLMLSSGGRLIIELSPMIADVCQDYVEQIAELDDLRFIKDLAGNQRILSVSRST